MMKGIELKESLQAELSRKAIKIGEYLRENIGAPSHSRDFSIEDINNLAGIWIKLEPDSVLDKRLFNKIYSYYIGIKSFDAEEELFPDDYYSDNTYKFNIGDTVYYNRFKITDDFPYSSEPRYKIIKVYTNYTANIEPLYFDKLFNSSRVKFDNIPFSKLVKAEEPTSWQGKFGDITGLY